MLNSWRRTHTCGELGAGEVGQSVVLMGWVDVIRDLGGITFLELRDRMGVTQILISPSSGAGVKSTAKRVGSEWVVAVKGEVLRRAEDNINRSVATGEIEVRADGIEVLSEAKTPPFELTEQRQSQRGFTTPLPLSRFTTRFDAAQSRKAQQARLCRP